MAKFQTVTPMQLWQFLAHCAYDHPTYESFRDSLSEDETCSFREGKWRAMNDTFHGGDFHEILVDTSDDESDFCCTDCSDVVRSTMQAIKDGYAIVNWVGPNGETLIAGYRPRLFVVAA